MAKRNGAVTECRNSLTKSLALARKNALQPIQFFCGTDLKGHLKSMFLFYLKGHMRFPIIIDQ